MKTALKLLAIAMFCVAAVVALNYIGDDYVPSAEQLLHPRNPTREFLIDAHTLQGIYGNMDVDCFLYEYVTRLDETAFWDAVEVSATNVGWKLMDTKKNSRRYIRMTSAKGKEVYGSAEEVRVAFSKPTKKVLVGWVQADTGGVSVDFPMDSSEARFAEKFVWSKFDDNLQKLNAAN